jgi:gas vesicle protein
MSSNTNNTVEEAKSTLGQMLHSVVEGVQNVAHQAVETIQHGVEVAESVGLSVAESAIETGKSILPEVTHKAAEVFEAGKEKVAELTKTALDKTEGVREVAGEYIEAGKEKAAQLTHTALEKTEGIREVAGEVTHKAAEVLEAGKHALSGTLPATAEELKDAAGEVASDIKEKAEGLKETASKGRKRKAQQQPHVESEAEKLIKKTHGDEVDITGHIVVAPENVKEGKPSDYEGDWQTVGKDGHHSGGPHIVPNGTPAQ